MRRTRKLLFSDGNTVRAELLSTPLNRLGLKLNGNLLGACVRRLREEIDDAGITLRPHFYIGTEYGCCAGTANVSLGFWDADAALAELNKEARSFSYSEDEIMEVLRHEVGHAFCYSHKLYRQSEFRELFNVNGNFFNTYPKRDRFTPNPWSKNFVDPCGDHYAQKHPDDDFAETFAVWLDPRENWGRKYRYKPGALRKLEYIGRVVRKYGRARPLVENQVKDAVEPIEEMKMPLSRFLRMSPRRFEREAAGFVDPQLRRIFTARPRRKRGVTAAREFLVSQRRMLAEQVASEAGVDDVLVKDILDKMVSRARSLELFVKREDAQRAQIAMAACVTALARNYTLTEKFMP